jgi:hypothetical protein
LFREGYLILASRGTKEMIGLHPEIGHENLVSELSSFCIMSENIYTFPKELHRILVRLSAVMASNVLKLIYVRNQLVVRFRNTYLYLQNEGAPLVEDRHLLAVHKPTS